jgi:PBP1b-binding outer membrane lipoprotein LpoB
MLNDALNTCNKKVTDIDTQIADSKTLKNKLQKKHFDILKAQNLSTKKVYDSNGQFKEIHESENKYSSKLKRMFKQLERDIKEEDKKQEKLSKQKSSFEEQLKYLKQLKEKAQKNPF